MRKSAIGNNNALGAIRSEEFKQNLRKPQSEERRQKLIGNKNALGCHRTDEYKQHMSNIKKDKHPSDETKQKMRISRLKYLATKT